MSANHGKQRSMVACGFLAAGLAFALPAESAGANVTACTTINLCYCMNESNRGAIDDNIARVRKLIVDQKIQGKAIGYMSIPLSTAGGSYYGVNADVAKDTKDAIERRLGQRSAWVLNPAVEGNLPRGASGADYMYMWTKIMEGRGGLGEDFDFIYFVGPSEFARFFGLTGTADMERIEAYFDDRFAKDPDFKTAVEQGKVSKAAFRNYYGLRASVSFSYGSHDEWNIARLLNEHRRGSADFGIANQLPVLFDGRAATPGNFEAAVAGGDVGRCIN
jgi:hypothetical protein